MNKNEKIKKIQELNFKSLLEFKRICDKYNINYVLGYGTLLGSVRHKGYIPWDDDSDVLMLREDYNKFEKVAFKELNDNFKLLTVNSHKYYPHNISRIIYKGNYITRPHFKNQKWESGIQLDIFVLDYTSRNKFAQKIQYIFANKIEALLVIKAGNTYHNNLLRRTLYNILNVLLLIVPRKLLLNIQSYWMNKYNRKKKKSGILVNFAFVYKNKEYITDNYILKTTNGKFCDTEFKIPVDYDQYLKHYYDDYMKLPPESQHRTHVVNEIKF